MDAKARQIPVKCTGTIHLTCEHCNTNVRIFCDCLQVVEIITEENLTESSNPMGQYGSDVTALCPCCNYDINFHISYHQNIQGTEKSSEMEVTYNDKVVKSNCSCYPLNNESNS